MADDVASTSSKQFFLQALSFLLLRSSLEREQDPNGILARMTRQGLQHIKKRLWDMLASLSFIASLPLWILRSLMLYEDLQRSQPSPS